MNAEKLVSMERIERIQKLITKFPMPDPKMIIRSVVFYPDKMPSTIDGKTPSADTLNEALNVIEKSFKISAQG